MCLTDDGRRVASVPDFPLTDEELHRRVLDRLDGPMCRLLAPLLEAYPDSIGNEELAEKAGYAPSSGGYNNPRGRLRTLGLVNYPQPGYVQANGLLFPEAVGRRSHEQRPTGGADGGGEARP